MGMDGFRVDAVPYLYEREGTNCENLPETHEFLKKLRQFVDTNYPDAIMLGEANQWPQDVRPYFGDDDEFQMCFNFPLMPRLYHGAGEAGPQQCGRYSGRYPPNCRRMRSGRLSCAITTN